MVPGTLSGTGAAALKRRVLAFIRSGQKKTKGSFEDLALAVFDHQFRQNIHYRAFCLAAGKNLRKISRWQDIPAVPALAFKELVLTTFPAREAMCVFKTSGTTHNTEGFAKRRPGRGAHFFETLVFYKAAIPVPFKEHLLSDGAGGFSFFFLMPSPKETRDSSLSYMMGVVDRRFNRGKGRYYVQKGIPQLDRLEEDLKRSKNKVFLFSTAFALKVFLDKLAKKNKKIKLKTGSRLMETGGFKGRTKEVSKKNLYRECHKRLNLRPEYCVSEYGMTELSSQFYDTTLKDKVLGLRRKPFKVGPPWTRTLVIDPKTGQQAKKGKIGLLRHFDLANVGSVMAVQTEDLGRQAGDGFELLGRAPQADVRGCSVAYEEFLRG